MFYSKGFYQDIIGDKGTFTVAGYGYQNVPFIVLIPSVSIDSPLRQSKQLFASHNLAAEDM